MKLGIIGSGNIGGAILHGVMKAGALKPEEVLLTDIDAARAHAISEPFGVRSTSDNREAAVCDIVVLAVKPYFYEQVISEIRPYLRESTLVVSVAPCFSLNTLQGWLPEGARVIRLMPNTPAMVGAGVVALCAGANVSRGEIDDLKSLLSPMGLVEEMPERLFDAIVGMSGSSPAYTFMFIEALAESGVLYGMPYDQSLRIAEQTVLGSAKLALESGKHPAALRNQVCTPGGTAIEAVRSLQSNAFQGIVMDAVAACVEKARRMKE